VNGFNYFNLALLDVHEAVRLFALLGHDRALGYVTTLPAARMPQPARGKVVSYHLAQIFAYRLHAGSQVGLLRILHGRNDPLRWSERTGRCRGDS